jgi:hypothetical protein
MKDKIDTKKIIELCDRLLKKDPNIVEIFESLCSLLINYDNQDLWSFVSGMASDMDHIPYGKAREFYSEEYLQQIDKEEKEIAEFHSEYIEKSALELSEKMIEEARKNALTSCCNVLANQYDESDIKAIDDGIKYVTTDQNLIKKSALINEDVSVISSGVKDTYQNKEIEAILFFYKDDINDLAEKLL